MIQIHELPPAVAAKANAAPWRSCFDSENGGWLAFTDPEEPSRDRLQVYCGRCDWGQLQLFGVPLDYLRAELNRRAAANLPLVEFATRGLTTWSPVANWLGIASHALFVGERPAGDDSRRYWHRTVPTNAGESLWLHACLSSDPQYPLPILNAEQTGELVMSLKSLM